MMTETTKGNGFEFEVASNVKHYREVWDCPRFDARFKNENFLTDFTLVSAGYFDWDTVWRNQACIYEVLYIRLTKQKYNNCFFWKSDSVKTLMPGTKKAAF